jgi:hypothetical protein
MFASYNYNSSHLTVLGNPAVFDKPDRVFGCAGGTWLPVQQREIYKCLNGLGANQTSAVEAHCARTSRHSVGGNNKRTPSEWIHSLDLALWGNGHAIMNADYYIAQVRRTRERVN